MRRLLGYAAWILAGGYIMCLGASAMHQYEALNGKDKTTYVYVEVLQDDEDTEYAEETVITGEAVLAYSTYELTQEELEEELYWDGLELLAQCVEAEAGNQGLLGKRLVADVILNRVDDPDFPDTIEGVITQPYHFTSYWDGRMSQVSISDETFLAVSMELENRSYPSLFFFTAGAYGDYGTPWQQIGDHYFSTK